MAKLKKPKFTRILSIDGGGIRGIIPGQVLVALEEMLQKATKKPTARIADFFDLIAGTSTGGILTCAYLMPGKGGRPKFSAQEAVDLYIERGDEVFNISTWHKITSGAGLLDEKYPADGLEEVLEDYFEEVYLKDLLGACLITAYDIKRRRTHFFAQQDAKNHKFKDFKVRDVARATSAAPTYFEVARIKSEARLPHPLIDGGVFANNPALCAYAEARKLQGNPKAREMVILSLGTGTIKKQYDYAEAKDWGKVEWILPVLDIMMSGVSETVHYQLHQIYDAVGKPDQYLRIEPDLRDASPEMDDVSPENLIALREAGTAAAIKNLVNLDAFIKLLRA